MPQKCSGSRSPFRTAFLSQSLLILSTLISLSITRAGAQSLTSFVDPYIGSGSHGHVFVGASVPFGAVQVGPNNIYKGWDWCSGYNYADSILIGFSQTHLSGTGIGDLGDVLIMPYTGKVRTDKGTEKDPASGYASHYSHKSESVKPGYYSVNLLDHNVKVELTASERVGFHQYHFPAGKEAHIIIDLKEGINDKSTETFLKQVDAITFIGRRFSSGWAAKQQLYFAIKISEAVNDFQIYEDNNVVAGKEYQGKSTKGLINFPKGGPATLQLKIGISPVSAENALASIAAEIPGWDFNKVARDADQKWNRELSTVQVQTKNLRDKKVFYTSLYHTMINPSLFNDVNGDYRGADKQEHKTTGFQNYSVFSLWDTYRAANPLFNLIQPKRSSDMINSMVAIGQQGGMIPVWHLMGNETFTMAGISGLQVVAEAYLKGIKGINPDTALRVMKTSAMSDYRGLASVKQNKTIPADKMVESVAAAMEYAISDHAIALMAKKLGRTEDYNYFINRSKNYKLYYDPATQFFRAKKGDGNWTDNFSPMKTTGKDYTEGNAWQYLWLVPQDIAGLKSLLGGNRQFTEKLDSFFTLKLVEETGTLSDVTGLIGQYAHGNEPGHHIPYLYAHGGQQWKTAEKVRFIMQEFYHDKPDGVIGNEDCGQMSAWFVLSALGFYPVLPASETYVIGSPLVDRATIQVPGGKPFTVIAEGNSAQNIYVQRLELNGKAYTKSWIHHSELLKGGTLKFVMGSKPNKEFGSAEKDRPE